MNSQFKVKKKQAEPWIMDTILFFVSSLLSLLMLLNDNVSLITKKSVHQNIDAHPNNFS